MFHTQPVKWEVVDSYAVDPIRIYVEDEGATIVRLASNEIVGNYVFDMDLQSRPAPPQRSPARRRGSNSSSKRSNEPIPTRRRSLPQSTPPPGGIRPILRDHNSDSHDAITNSTTPPLDQEGSPSRTTSPEPIAPSSSLPLGARDAVSSSKHNSVLSSALSLFKPRRTGSTSSGSNSDSGSGSGSSDGDSDSSAKSTKSSDFFHRNCPSSKHAEAAPLHRPYDKVDLKKALIFARGEILKQVETSGKNALVLEGWNITVLCRGHQYRLQIEYTARPAVVIYEDKPRTRRPPYLQILDS